MTFEELIAMVFQPGMYDVFCLGMSFVFVCFFLFLFFICLFELCSALCERFIWPGKQIQDNKEAP